MQDAPPPDPRRQRRTRREPGPPGPAPTGATLREAALAHLARFAATEAGLVRVLDRRIQRWTHASIGASTEPDQVAAQTAAAREQARRVAADLVRIGVLDDAAFAASRARSLARSGRSRRAIGAHLAGRGVDPELARAPLPEEAGSELAAALLQARRRRIGPFGDPDADAPARNKALGALARAGFDHDVATRALSTDREEAERLILELRRL